MIDFSELALSPNESRAARNFLGLSQAQTADQSGLPAHKLKRFETGNYVPDAPFIEELREFYEAQGYNFHDDKAPGAKAKARGDVFPAGVVGGTEENQDETGSSPLAEPGKLPRPQSKQLQYMRITPALLGDQVDRVFDCIEDNETAFLNDAGRKIDYSIWVDGPPSEYQVLAISLLRRLAENGMLYAKLMGRDLLPLASKNAKDKAASSNKQWETVGELLRAALGDAEGWALTGNKEAQARRKGRAEPTEVLQALVG